LDGARRNEAAVLEMMPDFKRGDAKLTPIEEVIYSEGAVIETSKIRDLGLARRDEGAMVEITQQFKRQEPIEEVIYNEGVVTEEF
jgi:hypothetical protein